MGEAEKSLPRLVGWQPARPSRPRCRQKKAASYWVEVAGGAGVDKTTHSPPFFPRPELEEEEEEEEKVEEKGLKGRRRRLRISGGSVRLGRTKIARSIRKSQPSPHNRLFQPLSLLLLFLLLLQATRPWPEISTGILSLRLHLTFLSLELVTIAGRQTANWLRPSCPLVTSWLALDA